MSEGSPPPPPENPSGAQPSAGGPPPPPPPSNDPAPPPASSQPGGYQAAPPPPPSAPGGPRPGELLDRFLARLIDGILLLVVVFVINAVIIAAILGTSGSFMSGGGTVTYAIVSSIISVVINLGYFGFMESSQGKTLGKMAMKLHVEGPSGGNPTFEEAVKRNWWLALGLLGVIPFVGIIGSLAQLAIVIVIAVQINSDPERRPSLTDKLAGTRVVKEG